MKKSVGQASYEILNKEPELIAAIDLQREMQKSALKEIDEILSTHKDYADKYYILYMLSKDRVIPNSIKQRFIVRKTRPRPDYDCSLFEVDNRTGDLHFHWTIPDEETCIYLLANKSTLSSEEQSLVAFVEAFSEGTLK